MNRIKYIIINCIFVSSLFGATLNTDKQVYLVGEPIVIQFTGSGYEKDWIGIYDLPTVPAIGSWSLVWGYCNSGTTTPAENVLESGSITLNYNFAPGIYKIYMGGGGFDVNTILAQTTITVAPSDYVAPVPVGEWLFDNPQNLTAAKKGTDLILQGSCNSINGPTPADGAVRIGVGSHFKLTHGLPSNNGNFVNTYSVLFDFRVKNTQTWYSFFQANGANNDDAELFIRNPEGTIGVVATGYSTKIVTPNIWNRLIVVVNNGLEYSLYLNGEKILNGTIQANDSRFGLRNQILLFGDNDGEDGEIDVARVSLYNKALSKFDAQLLGDFNNPALGFTLKPYLQNITTDGATIMWESATDKPGKVQYGSTSGTYNAFVSSNVITTREFGYVHKARIESLQPDKTYYYRVISNDSLYVEQNFKTLSTDTSKPFKIGIWGDSHNYGVLSGMANWMLDDLKADFCFTSGDLTNAGDYRGELVKVYFPQVLQKIASRVPLHISFGNHDVAYSSGGGDMIRQYVDQPKQFNSDYAKFSGSYAFTYGNSVFISIDWNRMYNDLLPGAWVENFLKSSTALNAKFRFIFIHCAPYYERWQAGEETVVKENLPPLCQKYGINAVFSGHTHAYERSLLNGVNYFTQGGGSYMDVNEQVGPVIYSQIVVGTNKAGNPPFFNNGLTNHCMSLEVTSEKATARLHYFDASGNFQRTIETVEMLPRSTIASVSDTKMLGFDSCIEMTTLKGIYKIISPERVVVGVYDLNGKLLCSFNNLHQYDTIDLSHLAKGMYVVRISRSQNTTSKIVVL